MFDFLREKTEAGEFSPFMTHAEIKDYALDLAWTNRLGRTKSTGRGRWLF